MDPAREAKVRQKAIDKGLDPDDAVAKMIEALELQNKLDLVEEKPKQSFFSRMNPFGKSKSKEPEPEPLVESDKNDEEVGDANIVDDNNSNGSDSEYYENNIDRLSPSVLAEFSSAVEENDMSNLPRVDDHEVDVLALVDGEKESWEQKAESYSQYISAGLPKGVNPLAAAAASRFTKYRHDSDTDNDEAPTAPEKADDEANSDSRENVVMATADPTEQANSAPVEEKEIVRPPSPQPSVPDGAWVSVGSKLPSRRNSRPVSRRPSGTLSLFARAVVSNSTTSAGGQAISASSAPSRGEVTAEEMDRLEKQRVWATWFKEEVPDVSVAQALKYINMLWDAQVTTPARLNKRLLKNPDALLDMGFHEDDAEDVAQALNWSITNGSETSPAKSPSKAEQAILPNVPSEVEMSLEAKGEEAQKGSSSVEEDKPLPTAVPELPPASDAMNKYMNPEDDNYVSMLVIDQLKELAWGKELEGIVISILENENSMWVHGQISGLSKLSEECHCIILSDGTEFELNLSKFARLKIELCDRTKHHVVSSLGMPERYPRSMFYPELGSLPVPFGGNAVKIEALQDRLNTLQTWIAAVKDEIKIVDDKIQKENDAKQQAEAEKTARELHLQRQEEIKAMRAEQEAKARREADAREEAAALAALLKEQEDLLREQAAAEAEKRRLKSEADNKARELAKQKAYEEQRARIMKDSQVSTDEGGQRAFSLRHVEQKATSSDHHSGGEWAGRSPSDILKRRTSHAEPDIAPEHVVSAPLKPPSPVVAPVVQSSTPTPPKSQGRRLSMPLDPNAPPPPAMLSPIEKKHAEGNLPTPPKSQGRRLSMPLDPNAPPPPAMLSPIEKKYAEGNLPM
jgi:hypothetical protein